jgi:hypothetical protein
VFLEKLQPARKYHVGEPVANLQAAIHHNLTLSIHYSSSSQTSRQTTIQKRRLLNLFSFYTLDSPFKLGLGLAGSLVGVIVNLLVVVAVRTDSRLVLFKKKK